MTRSFFNLYSHDFARVAVAVPGCRVADPAFNAKETRRLAREAAQKGALLVVFPELGISAYTCDDLFQQRALLDACEAAIGGILRYSRSTSDRLAYTMPGFATSSRTLQQARDLISTRHTLDLYHRRSEIMSPYCKSSFVVVATATVLCMAACKPSGSSAGAQGSNDVAASAAAQNSAAPVPAPATAGSGSPAGASQ